MRAIPAVRIPSALTKRQAGRTYAKQVFQCLAAHEIFDRALTQSVSTPVLRNIHKTLMVIRKECYGAQVAIEEQTAKPNPVSAERTAIGDPSTTPAPPTEELARQQQTAAASLDADTNKETGEGVDHGPSQVATEETNGSSTAVGSAASGALAIIASADTTKYEEGEEGGVGKEEGKMGGEGSGGGGSQGGAKVKVIGATPEEVEPMTHPCVPKESGDRSKEGDDEERKEERGEEDENESKGEETKEEKRKSSEEEEEVGDSGVGEKGEVEKSEKREKEEGGEEDEREEGKSSQGAEVVEKKRVADDDLGEKEEGKEEGGEKIEVEGEEAPEAAVHVHNDQTDSFSPPEKETNCGGGVAVPIDLSVGLLGSSVDERAKEDTAFTTLPPDAAFSPPPRPKNLSCSYSCGTLKHSLEVVEEHAMSATIALPNAGLHEKGTDHSLITSSSEPTNAYDTKNAQKRNHKLMGGQRAGRRSLGARNTMQKHSVSSVSSAPNVHRSSSMSTSLFPETLPPVKNPKQSLKQAFQNMDDPDWEVAMKGLELLVRLIRHHPSYVQAELTRVIATLARQIRNLRSQVARAACQASGELALPRVFPSSPASINSDSSTNSSSSTSLLRRALEADLEEVAEPLLHRSADTNRFLRDDCVAALDRFVAGVGPARVVGPILSKGVTHQNALVRTVTARLLATIVSKLGAERVMDQLNKDVRGKILRAGANLLMEGSLQTRTYAKEVFRCLAAHESFHRAITQSVPTSALRNIHKTLITIGKERETALTTPGMLL